MTSGELNALQQCQDAVASGGVAFLLIRGQLIMEGPPETGEDVWWRRIPHTAGRPVGKAGPSPRGVNAWPPNHWVVFLGASAAEGQNHDAPTSLHLWS